MDIQYLKGLILALEETYSTTQTVDRDQLCYDVVMLDAMTKANRGLKDVIKKYSSMLIVLENRERTKTYKNRLEQLYDGVGVYEASVITARAKVLCEEYKQDSELGLLATDKTLDVSMRDIVLTTQEKIMRNLEPKDFLDDTDIAIITDPAVASKNESFKQKSEEHAADVNSQVCKNAQVYSEKLASDMSVQGIDVVIEESEFSVINPRYDRDMSSLRGKITTASDEDRMDLENERQRYMNSTDRSLTLNEIYNKLLNLREILISPSDFSGVDVDMKAIDAMRITFSSGVMTPEETVSMNEEALEILVRYGIYADRYAT